VPFSFLDRGLGKNFRGGDEGGGKVRSRIVALRESEKKRGGERGGVSKNVQHENNLPCRPPSKKISNSSGGEKISTTKVKTKPKKEVLKDHTKDVRRRISER